MQHKTNARSSRAGSSYGGRKGGSRGGSRPSGRRRFTGNVIDVSRFICKAKEIVPTEVFKPRYAFNDLEIHTLLKRAIESRGFATPTPIQDQAIPAILSGKDVIGLANTGTGKTGAFLIPMINKILLNPREKVLIVTPTRELAIQIQDEFMALAKRLNIFSVVVVGGADIRRQIKEMHRRHNLVVGTPGRLKDLITRKVLDLSQFSSVVLDEADRMLDMGFINDVNWLLSLVAKQRQIMLFSATFGAEIESLTRKFLNQPVKISVKSGESSAQIDQNIVRMEKGKDKTDTLHDLLIQAKFEKVLIFTRTKHGADKLTKSLLQRGFKTESIHGDKPHSKRQRALKMFKENIVEILVATDVAARGLDIPNVSHVINFDLPATYEDYVHRIGRTGRADKKGIALTFVE
ncbi:MAG: ATP-dependent RNA helicase RhlE [Candidatus Moranbacteria bacterium GW2011_GWF2_36_839]|nr:MAG: ATP-dependent RNA helicase RhlE [Candidatus Moranbacteria bacterium GW2011_GWF1_36_78]KKQ16674.1 MAG: ATP-dependent RNA helicase RhlE [Candidatus Moranbacteria bacterium GW2011_GWF2_36_839]HAT73572.1 ATP-dependent helicase [Candidatus Moranbacteria bacterium]HBY11452.1 ATP-dependent helicase [Candidatus Moranbacteria bacterium]